MGKRGPPDRPVNRLDATLTLLATRSRSAHALAGYADSATPARGGLLINPLLTTKRSESRVLAHGCRRGPRCPRSPRTPYPGAGQTAARPERRLHRQVHWLHGGRLGVVDHLLVGAANTGERLSDTV